MGPQVLVLLSSSRIVGFGSNDDSLARGSSCCGFSSGVGLILVPSEGILSGYEGMVSEDQIYVSMIGCSGPGCGLCGSIGLVLWFCVSISYLVCVVARARVVGGFWFDFLCSGCGLVLSLVGMLVCPVCGVR